MITDSRGRDEDASFREYRKLFLAQLEQLQVDIKEARRAVAELRETELSNIRTDIALLKLKNSLWAVLISSLSSGLITAIALFASRTGH